MRCVFLMTLLLLSGCSAGGCTRSTGGGDNLLSCFVED
jgi:hypothetical protein